jgi:hypothetical protein
MLTAERLRKVLAYNPETGAFQWNSTGSGRSAKPGCLDADGYWRIGIDYRMYKAHRLAWLYMNGEWPTAEIDHINCDKLDNRIANLRLCVGGIVNAQNQAGPTRRNKSGRPGLFWFAKTNRWRVQITCNKKQIHLGYFKDIEEAAAVYAKAKAEMHPASRKLTTRVRPLGT